MLKAAFLNKKMSYSIFTCSLQFCLFFAIKEIRKIILKSNLSIFFS